MAVTWRSGRVEPKHTFPSEVGPALAQQDFKAAAPPRIGEEGDYFWS